MIKFSEISTDLTRQARGEPVTSWNCPSCGWPKTQYSVRIVNAGRTDPHFPRWIPQVKESCAQCGRYRRFAPQSEMLIKRINDRLGSIFLPQKGRDFYEESQK